MAHPGHQPGKLKSCSSFHFCYCMVWKCEAKPGEHRSQHGTFQHGAQSTTTTFPGACALLMENQQLSAELLSPFRSFLKFSIAAQAGRGQGAGWKDGTAHEKKAAEWADCVVVFFFSGWVLCSQLWSAREETVGTQLGLQHFWASQQLCSSWCSQPAGPAIPLLWALEQSPRCCFWLITAVLGHGSERKALLHPTEVCFLWPAFPALVPNSHMEAAKLWGGAGRWGVYVQRKNPNQGSPVDLGPLEWEFFIWCDCLFSDWAAAVEHRNARWGGEGGWRGKEQGCSFVCAERTAKKEGRVVAPLQVFWLFIWVWSAAPSLHLQGRKNS